MATIDSEISEMDLNDKIVLNFARKLACNDQSSRTRGLKQLKLFLQRMPEDVEELVLLRLWKGLHFCMWMADKALFQEDLASKTSRLIHLFPHKGLSVRFFAAFLHLEALEWPLIDALRIDKFMMLVRLMVREILVVMKGEGWDEGLSGGLVKALRHLFRERGAPRGLLFHVIEVLVCEVEKVAEDEHSGIPSFLKGLTNLFIALLSTTHDEYLAREIKKNVLYKFTRPAFKMDLGWMEERLFTTASRASCRHRPLLYTLLKQIGGMKEGKEVKKKPLKKDLKRKRVDEEWQGMVEGAVRRLKDYEMSVMRKKKDGGGDDDDEDDDEEDEDDGDQDEVNGVSDDDDDDDDDDEEDNNDDADDDDGGLKEKIGEKKESVFVNGTNSDDDDGDDGDDDGDENDGDDEGNEDDDDEEDDDYVSGDDEDLGFKSFLDMEVEEDIGDDDDVVVVDEDDDDDGVDELDDDDEEEDGDDDEIKICGNKGIHIVSEEDIKKLIDEDGSAKKRKRCSTELKTPVKQRIALKDNVKSSEKKSVVFNNKCLSKKFHQHTRVTPKFDPSCKPVRSALKSSSPRCKPKQSRLTL